MSKLKIVTVSILLVLSTPFIVIVNFWELSTETYISSFFSLIFTGEILALAVAAVLFPLATLQLLIQFVLKSVFFFYALRLVNRKISISWIATILASVALLGMTHAVYYYFSLSMDDISDSRASVSLVEEFKADVYVGMTQEEFESYLESNVSIRDFSKLYYFEFDDGSYNIADYYTGSREVTYTLGSYILNGSSYDGIPTPRVYFKDGVIIGVFAPGEINSEQQENDLFKTN